MASTKQIQDSMNWSQQYLYSQPLALGAANEPAITIANVVQQTMLGPPFVWRQNRGQLAAPIALVQGQQDYVTAIPTLGFVEKAYLIVNGVAKEIEQIVEVLPAET